MKKLILFSLFVASTISALAAKYTLVTSTSDLASGDKIVLGVPSKNKASGAFSTNYLSAVDATFSGDTLYSTAAVDITIQGGGSSWTFYVGGAQIGATAEKSLSNDPTNSNFVGGWTVSIDSYGEATILLSTPKFANTNLYYNPTNPRFCNYASKQTAVQIYKKVEVMGERISASNLDLGRVSLIGGVATNSAVISVSGDNLPDTIAYIFANGDNFSASGHLSATGGNLTISFQADSVGTYVDTLALYCDSAWHEIEVKATVVAAGAKGNKFVLVSDVSSLAAGEEVIIVSSAQGKAATDISSQVMGTAAVTIDTTDNSILLTDTNVVVLTIGGSTGAWTLSSEGSMLSCTSVKKLAWTTTSSAAATWTISVNASGNATIQNNNSGTNYGLICYNTGSPRFTTYAATSASCILPQLYQRQAGGTAVDNNAAASDCKKVLRDGEILIIRDGVTYDLYGRRR